jgi:hypothetical protein
VKDGLKRSVSRKPLQAIRLKCLDCVCHQEKLIRECPILTCALWSYRMGRYPKAG